MSNETKQTDSKNQAKPAGTKQSPPPKQAEKKVRINRISNNVVEHDSFTVYCAPDDSGAR